MKKPNWLIGVTRNGQVCDCCGKAEYPYREYIANYTTIGLTARYHHLELQIVVDLGPEVICYILNTLGDAVRNGHCLRDGDIIDGVIRDFPIHIKRMRSDGVELFRVLLPDENGRFPDDPKCNKIFALQVQPLENLARRRTFEFPYDKIPN